MEYNKLVTVVMPVHNGETYIHQAIESVLKQTYTNFEFLIIENCSNDSSVKIIKSFMDPRIRLIIENDCGQVNAYNRGFKEAKGEYIFIHDQDDVSQTNRFKEQLTYVIENKIDICGSFINIIDSNGRSIKLQEKSKNHEEIKIDFFYNASAIHNSATIFNRKVFLKMGYWDAKFYPIADSEFFYRNLSSCIVFGNIPKYLYNYRIHNLQITSKPTKRGFVLLRNIQIKYLSQNSNEIKPKNYFFYKSLIYYYSDSLILSFLYNILSILMGKIDKKLFRYTIILIFFGLPLKGFRKYNFLRTKIFINIKLYFDKLFKIN
jgi:glycosyltransferase involved in cell wall biosynthesis